MVNYLSQFQSSRWDDDERSCKEPKCEPRCKVIEQHVDLVRHGEVQCSSPSFTDVVYQFPISTSGVRNVCYELLASNGDSTQSFEKCTALADDGSFAVKLPPFTTAFCVRACIVVNLHEQRCKLQVLGTAIFCCPTTADDCVQRCELRKVCNRVCNGMPCEDFCPDQATQQTLCFQFGSTDVSLYGGTWELLANLKDCQVQVLSGPIEWCDSTPVTCEANQGVFKVCIPANVRAFAITATVRVPCAEGYILLRGSLVCCGPPKAECEQVVPLTLLGWSDGCNVLQDCNMDPPYPFDAAAHTVCYQLGFGQTKSTMASGCADTLSVRVIIRYVGGAVEVYKASVDSMSPSLWIDPDNLGVFRVCIPKSVSGGVESFAVCAEMDVICGKTCDAACVRAVRWIGSDVQCKSCVPPPFELQVECGPACTSCPSGATGCGVCSYGAVGVNLSLQNCPEILSIISPVCPDAEPQPTYCADPSCYEFRSSYVSSQRRCYCRFILSSNSEIADAAHTFTIVDQNTGDSVMFTGDQLKNNKPCWPYVVNEDLSLLSSVCLKATASPREPGCAGVPIESVVAASLPFCNLSAQPSLCMAVELDPTPTQPFLLELFFQNLALALVEKPSGCIKELLVLQRSNVPQLFWSGEISVSGATGPVPATFEPSGDLLSAEWTVFDCQNQCSLFLDAPCTVFRCFNFNVNKVAAESMTVGNVTTLFVTVQFDICISLPQCMLHCLDDLHEHGLLIGAQARTEVGNSNNESPNVYRLLREGDGLRLECPHSNLGPPCAACSNT